MKIKPT